MKLKQIKLFSILAIYALTFKANADVNTGGWYAGLGGGISNNSGGTGQLNVGYLFGLFGIEGNYTFWGNQSNTGNYNGMNFNYSLNSPQSLDAMFKLDIPLGQSPLSIHAGIGLAYAFLNSDDSLLPDGNSVTPSGSAFTSIGNAGIGLNLGKSLKLNVDWNSYGFYQPVGITANGQTVGTWSTNNYLVNLNYYFN